MSELLLQAGTWDQVTPESAGWRHLAFGVRSGSFESQTGEFEIALVPLSGRFRIESDGASWELGGRENVFAGLPWALYLPRDSAYRVEGTGEIAVCGARCERRRDPVLVEPEEVEIEVRGSGNATRQINHLLKPEFPAERLLVVEVLTPSGNWSSYPPHKHDVHRAGQDGGLLEADLEEVYLYKMREPGGHALQRIYTDHGTGDGALDVTVTARDGDIVLVPYGYHPVSAPYGYDCYYINFLAGSAQSLACADDPEHAWIKSTWTTTDPRIPMVTHEMERVAAATGAGRELAR